MKQKTRRTTEEQATEDNQNVKEKKPTMTGRGNTPEDTRYSQPEFPAQVRPPEENPTTMQDAPNREEDHSQTDTNRNNKQHTKKYAGGGTNKVFWDRGGSQSRPGEGDRWTSREERVDNQGQHTANTLKKPKNTRQKRASEERDTSKKRHQGRKDNRREGIKAVKLRAKGSDVTWKKEDLAEKIQDCLLYTSPSPRDS